VILAIIEFAARTSWAQKTFTYRSVNNYHYQFEIKWFKLADYIEQNGGVDVIILGSSLVNTGIDPDVMGQTYYERTGQRLRIFNFGVEGLTVEPNSITARVLVERYHPGLLIYDFIAGNGEEIETRFLADPWFRFENGQFNFLGWMIDHSAAIQYYLPYRNWMRADFLETMPGYLGRYRDTTASGYEADHKQGKNIDAIPDPGNPSDAAEFEMGRNYQIAQSRLDALQRILDLRQDDDTAVLVVEMPVHPTFYVYVGGENVHQRFQQELVSFVDSSGATFIPANTCDNIPLAGRSNRLHLNELGAPVFSECLGEQLVILAKQQNTDFISEQVDGSE
jgi:hypothetical protein